jgi:hypothetical protein
MVGAISYLMQFEMNTNVARDDGITTMEGATVSMYVVCHFVSLIGLHIHLLHVHVFSWQSRADATPSNTIQWSNQTDVDDNFFACLLLI